MVDYVEKIVTVPANANSVTIYADPGEVWKITGVPYCWNLPQGDPIWANIEQSGGNIANIGQWKPNTEVYISDTIGLRLTFAPYGSDRTLIITGIRVQKSVTGYGECYTTVIPVAPYGVQGVSIPNNVKALINLIGLFIPNVSSGDVYVYFFRNTPTVVTQYIDYVNLPSSPVGTKLLHMQRVYTNCIIYFGNNTSTWVYNFISGIRIE